jgi:hypothetical protein
MTITELIAAYKAGLLTRAEATAAIKALIERL